MVLLIKHATVATPQSGGGSGWRLIKDGAVAVEGSRIASVDTTSALEKKYGDGDECVDGSGCIVVPGFVDAHTHVAGSCFRGMLEDIPDHFYGYALKLEEYMTPEMVYAFSLLGAVEALRFGVTTVNDHYHMGRQVAQALVDSGIGGVVAHTVTDVRLGEIGSKGYARDRRLGEEALEESVSLVEHPPAGGKGRMSYTIGPHATDTCTPALLSQAADEAARLGVGLHIHVAQSQREVDQVAREHSTTPVGLLARTGVLGPRLIAAHLIYASAADVEKVARSKAASAYCPVVYGKNGRLPDTAAMFSSGTRLGLGTDWLSMNPWDMMRQMVAFTRITVGRDALGAQKVMRLATLGAAEALNMAGEVGSIEPGKRADIVVVDASSPHMTPMQNHVENAVYYAEGGDVRQVFVAGRRVVKDGVVTTVDQARVAEAAQSLAEELWSNLPYPSRTL